MNTFRLSTPRLLAGFGTAALLGAVCLVSSHPAHTASGPIAVTVANTPLSNTPTDNSAKQGVQFSLGPVSFSPFGGGSSGSHIAYTVPAGKRLVIETVTAFAGDQHSYDVFCSSAGGLNPALVVTTFSVLPDGSSHSKGAEHPYQYAEAGTTVTLNANLVGAYSSGSYLLVTFTGYLVDIATPGGSS